MKGNNMSEEIFGVFREAFRGGKVYIPRVFNKKLNRWVFPWGYFATKEEMEDPKYRSASPNKSRSIMGYRKED